MDSGKNELPKTWHMLKRPIEIASGIRGHVGHATTAVIDVAIKPAGRNNQLPVPGDLSLRRKRLALLLIRPASQAQSS